MTEVPLMNGICDMLSILVPINAKNIYVQHTAIMGGHYKEIVINSV